MKIKVNTKQLQDAIKIITKCTSKKMYNLESNIKIDVNNNILNLYANNYTDEISHSINIENENTEPLTIFVFAKKLFDVVKYLDKKIDCEIEIDGEKIYIIQAEHKSLIIGMQYNELVELETNINNYVEIDSQDFLTAIDDCQKCLATEPFKPALRGMYFDFETAEPNTMNIVATDGRRMKVITLEYKGDRQKNIIVEPSTINLIKSSIKKIKNSTSNISLGIDEKFIKINSHGYTITAIGIDGKYPDYHKVIPKAFDNFASTDKKQLLNAIKIIKPMISDLRSKKFFIKIVKNEMYIISVNREMGQSQVIIDCQSEIENLEQAFNINYFENAIKKSTDDKIILKLSNDNKPCEIANTIIMPMSATDDGEYYTEIMKPEYQEICASIEKSKISKLHAASHDTEIIEPLPAAIASIEIESPIHAATAKTIPAAIGRLEIKKPIYTAIESTDRAGAIYTKLATDNNVFATNRLTRKQRKKAKYQRRMLAKHSIKQLIENNNVKKANTIRANIIRLYGIDVLHTKIAA